MNNRQHLRKQNLSKPRQYRIEVEGLVGKKWQDWFDGFQISYNGINTIIAGDVKDQPELHGILARIRDLNLTLVALQRQGPANVEK